MHHLACMHLQSVCRCTQARKPEEHFVEQEMRVCMRYLQQQPRFPRAIPKSAGTPHEMLRARALMPHELRLYRLRVADRYMLHKKQEQKQT